MNADQQRLKQLQRSLADYQRDLRRVQSRIRVVADRAARDHKAATRRGDHMLADMINDRALPEIHGLEEQEVCLERRIEDINADITALTTR